ncbi:sensor histidine kinase [Lentzea tibetensis]|uniref:sensor histidine kinase n=1 Tax=Lentzea tibetensis TaxID=2591470 RepID=UPI001C9A0FFF|nr:sensor histidine kinase [Lentzea tibetensis]
MDTQRFDRIVRTGFFVVLAACTVRYLWWSGLVTSALPVVCGAAVLGLAFAFTTGRAGLVAVLVGWVVLTLVAASFTWLAVPFFFLVLRTFPARTALVLVVGITAFAAVEGTVHALTAWDPSPIIAPVAIAVLAFVLFRNLHEAGRLTERVRLSREIHDTLAQGLSSMHLLLHAADQEWDTAPGKAREHVRQAARTAQENLAEARRFVRELAPPALDGGSLPDALSRLTDDVRIVGEPYPVHVDVEIAVLRVAQNALANVKQHASASRVVVTLTYLNGELTLDVCDDGVGFDASACRGFGLRATEQRVQALGGRVTVESAPGEGTVLALSLPTRGGS